MEIVKEKVVTSADDNQIIVWDSNTRKKIKSFIIDPNPGSKRMYGASSLSKLPDNQWSRSIWYNPKNDHFAIATNFGTVQIRKGIN